MNRRAASSAVLVLLAMGVAWWWHLGRIRRTADEVISAIEPMAVQEADEQTPEIVRAEPAEALVPVRKYPYLAPEVEALILQLEGDYLNLLVRIGTNEVPAEDSIRYDIAAAFFEDVIAIIPDHDQAVEYFREGLKATNELPLATRLTFPYLLAPTDRESALFQEDVLRQTYLFPLALPEQRTLAPVRELSEEKRALIENELIPAVNGWLADSKLVALLRDANQVSRPYVDVLSVPTRYRWRELDQAYVEIERVLRTSWFGGPWMGAVFPDGTVRLIPTTEDNFIYSDDQLSEILESEAAVREYQSTPIYAVLRKLVKID